MVKPNVLRVKIEKVGGLEQPRERRRGPRSFRLLIALTVTSVILSGAIFTGQLLGYPLPLGQVSDKQKRVRFTTGLSWTNATSPQAGQVSDIDPSTGDKIEPYRIPDLRLEKYQSQASFAYIFVSILSQSNENVLAKAHEDHMSETCLHYACTTRKTRQDVLVQGSPGITQGIVDQPDHIDLTVTTILRDSMVFEILTVVKRTDNTSSDVETEMLRIVQSVKFL